MRIEPDQFIAKCDVCDRLGPIDAEHGLVVVAHELSKIEFSCPACDTVNAYVVRSDGAAVRFMLNRGVPMQTDVFAALDVTRESS